MIYSEIIKSIFLMVRVRLELTFMFDICIKIFIKLNFEIIIFYNFKNFDSLK